MSELLDVLVTDLVCDCIPTCSVISLWTILRSIRFLRHTKVVRLTVEMNVGP